ncbi:MAG: hypothetical protein WKG01_12240 [Kofleriaceae bacterium]
MKTLVFFSSMMILVACGPGSRNGGDDDDDDDDGADGGPGSGSGEAKRCNKMDLVFVIDDSGSMGEEQDNLATNFPMFATLLSNYVNADGDKIDFRLAVTTTSRELRYTTQPPPPLPAIVISQPGDNGTFRNNCNLSRRWLEPNDPDMATTLSCRAKVGDDNPGAAEMPLLMPKYALSERMQDGTNTGFLREDALLAVVTLTDENDSSTTQNNFVLGPFDDFPLDFNPADLVAFYDNLKGNRTRWATAMIAGDGMCESAFGKADDAVRLKEFVTQANSQGSTQAVFSSICAGDLTIGLQQALELFQDACSVIIL